MSKIFNKIGLISCMVVLYICSEDCASLALQLVAENWS